MPIRVNEIFSKERFSGEKNWSPAIISGRRRSKMKIHTSQISMDALAEHKCLTEQYLIFLKKILIRHLGTGNPALGLPTA